MACTLFEQGSTDRHRALSATGRLALPFWTGRDAGVPEREETDDGDGERDAQSRILVVGCVSSAKSAGSVVGSDEMEMRWKR